MPTTFLDPCQILFTQSSIKYTFRNGLSLEETACQLASKETNKRNIDMIHVVDHGGHYYSLDNRRLAVFRLLRHVGKCGKIKVLVVNPDPAEWHRKFDRNSDHNSIEVRQVGYIIGPTKNTTTFPLANIRMAMRDSVTVLETRVAAILEGMDSDDDEEDVSGVLGRRPPRANQRLKAPMRAKNAADQRRGNKSGGWLHFADDLEPFAAGKTRHAFRCRVQGPCVAGFSQGSYLVLKVFKPEYKDSYQITSADAEMQQDAARLADDFNEQARPTQNGHPCPVYIRDAAVTYFHSSQRRRDGRVIIGKGENVMLEREIFGSFRKFNSNNGWNSKTGGQIPSAFSHWTWAKTGLLVCDLQGYQGTPDGPTYLGSEYYYLFTDPAIMSPDGRYGITDMGQQGIENWFSVHKCNDTCRALGIDRDRPSHCIRTLPVESSSSLRETNNTYGPAAGPRKALVLGLGAIEEGGASDSDYDDW